VPACLLTQAKVPLRIGFALRAQVRATPRMRVMLWEILDAARQGWLCVAGQPGRLRGRTGPGPPLRLVRNNHRPTFGNWLIAAMARPPREASLGRREGALDAANETVFHGCRVAGWDGVHRAGGDTHDPRAAALLSTAACQ